MNSFSVRVAKPEDLDRVTAVLEASYPALTAAAYDASVMTPEALALMTRAQPALLASGTFYVAETERGTVIGCGGWTEERPHEGGIEPGLAHIRHFGTHADWTGRGVGRSLYRRCEHDARRAGARAFECYSLLNAEAFYARLGFESVERIEVPMQGGIKMPCMLMRKAMT